MKLPAPALAVLAVDDDGGMIRAVPGLGYHGLVLAAFGCGHVPSWLAPVLAEVSGHIPVVLASRTNAGEIVRETYGYPGGEIDLIARGLVPAVSLDAAHATVLLRLLLMAGVPRDQLAWCFEQASSPSGFVTAPAPESMDGTFMFTGEHESAIHASRERG
jgi:L-asparaginase